jgi:hypothetical protein
MTTQNYIVNLTATNLVLKTGYMDIPAGGFAPISENDKTEQTIEWALGRNWARITDIKPEGVPTIVPEVEIEVTTPYSGMSADELQASKLIEPEVSPSSGATSTALGQGEQGVNSTPVVEDPEASATKSKKAK